MSVKEFLLTNYLAVYRKLLATKNMSEKEKALRDSFATVLLQPIVNPKDLDITYATIKYWEKKGYLLLPITKEVGEWRKFSILEYFWVQILKKATEIGCSLEVLAPQLLFAYENFKMPNDTIVYTALPDCSDTRFNMEGVRSNVFTHFLTQISIIAVQKTKTSVHLYTDSCQFTSESSIDKITAANNAYTTIYKTGVSICISDIVFENMQNDKYSFAAPLQVFSKQEIEILNLLKKNELREINIKLKNGKPVSMELKEQFDITTDDTSKRLKEFFSSGYQKISAVTNGGKTISFERTTKQKLNE